MKRLILPSVLCSIILAFAWTVFAGPSPTANVEKFTLRLWNGSYYCAVKFPDGTSQELKSTTDLNYKQWQVKIEDAWKAHIAPPPEPKPDLAAFTTDELKAELAKREAVK